jgi:hypothetical protein
MSTRVFSGARMELSIAAVAIVLGGALGWPLSKQFHGGGGSTSSRQAAESQHDTLNYKEQQLLMVVLVSKDCDWSTAPNFRDSLRILKGRLVRESAAANMAFSTLGVAVDHNPQEGIALLNELGPFDQLAVGDSWLNAAAIEYMWRDIPGEAALPQVVLVERIVTHTSNSLVVSDDSLVGRAVGPSAIFRWLARRGGILRSSTRAASVQ